MSELKLRMQKPKRKREKIRIEGQDKKDENYDPKRFDTVSQSFLIQWTAIIKPQKLGLGWLGIWRIDGEREERKRPDNLEYSDHVATARKFLKDHEEEIRIAVQAKVNQINQPRLL